MGLTLAQLVQLQTKEDLRELLLLGLQGIGFVAKSPASQGSGNLSAAGVSAGAASVQVKITTDGELGTGAFAVSVDGGVNFASPVTIPSSGLYTVGTTGLTVTFIPAPPSSGTSFITGDLYSIALGDVTFPVTAWQEGSTPLTMIELDAEGMENFSATQQAIALGGFLATAKGPWMDLLLDSVYDLQRGLGLVTLGNIVLTDSASAGPFTITINQLWFGTVGGLRYNNTMGGTLAKGGTLTLPIQSEQKGSRYNVAAGAISVMLTSLAGVTVTNPNPLGGSWITQSGADIESDSQAQVRARARWPALGSGQPNESYDLWAKTASPSVTRTREYPDVSNPGTVQVYLAGNAGAVDGSVVAAVQTYIDNFVMFTSVANVQSATPNSINVTGTLYVAAGNETAAAAAVSQNLAALFNSGINTKGDSLPGIDIGGVVYLDQIREQIMLAPGARNVPLSAPSGDTSLGSTDVAELVLAVAIVGV